MAASHIHKHLQSILVPKTQFHNEAQARKHVQSLGYQTNLKPVHITDNYYRYRQFNPQNGEKLRNIDMDKDKAIYSVGKGTTKIISNDLTTHLRHPTVHATQPPQRESLFNGTPKLGGGGSGIWLEKYKPEHLQDKKILQKQAENQQKVVIDYEHQAYKSNLTPFYMQDQNVPQKNDMLVGKKTKIF